MSKAIHWYILQYQALYIYLDSVLLLDHLPHNQCVSDAIKSHSHSLLTSTDRYVHVAEVKDTVADG